jgi:exodeoxyribonuclease VII small subunit
MAKKSMTYDDAVAEIESILEKIEEGSMGVDELAGKVKRATELIKLCRDRLYKAEEQIDIILKDDKEDEVPGTTH